MSKNDDDQLCFLKYFFSVYITHFEMTVDPTLLNKYPHLLHPSIYLLKYVVDISLPSSIHVCTWKQVSMTDGGSWFSSAVVKGQKISKGNCGVLNSSKKN